MGFSGKFVVRLVQLLHYLCGKCKVKDEFIIATQVASDREAVMMLT